MDNIIALVTLGVVLVSIIAWFWGRKSGGATVNVEDAGPVPVQRPARRGMGRMQMPRRRPDAGAEQDEDGSGPDEEEKDAPSLLNRRDQRKLDKKEGKAAAVQNRAATNDERNKRSEDKNRKQTDRDREIEQRFDREEQEAKRVEDEKLKKEEDEYNEWKDLITIEDQGEERSVLEAEGSLSKFLNYIKMRKVVELEDLAGEFQLDSKSIINRLQEL
jgi:hypothetical protein